MPTLSLTILELKAHWPLLIDVANLQMTMLKSSRHRRSIIVTTLQLAITRGAFETRSWSTCPSACPKKDLDSLQLLQKMVQSVFNRFGSSQNQPQHLNQAKMGPRTTDQRLKLPLGDLLHCNIQLAFVLVATETFGEKSRWKRDLRLCSYVFPSHKMKPPTMESGTFI